VDVILASKADVVTLSEVRNYHGKDLHKRLIRALVKKGRKFFGRNGGGDVGLLSRWPILKTESILDETREDCGSLIAFHLSLSEGVRLVVCSAHLDYRNYAIYLPRGYDGNSFKMIDKDKDGKPDPVTDLAALHEMDRASRRDEALKRFVRYANSKEIRRLPIILAGDFNEASHLDWTRETAEHFSHNGVVIRWKNSLMLHRAGMKDAWREIYPNPLTHPGATWPSEAWKKGSTSWASKVDERDRIDFVYYRAKGWKVRKAWLVGSSRYWVLGERKAPKTQDAFMLKDIPWPSDHKGLLVEFLSDSF
jgi:endonuclease/exonuclease/phosphatase family metal-dependent hydrolase